MGGAKKCPGFIKKIRLLDNHKVSDNIPPSREVNFKEIITQGIIASKEAAVPQVYLCCFELTWVQSLKLDKDLFFGAMDLLKKVAIESTEDTLWRSSQP